MRYAKNAADTAECRFWMAIQACEDYYKSDGEWNINLRAPTPEELSAEANLALCYGATGIMYYPYPTTVPDEDDTYKVRGLVTLVNSQEEPIWQLEDGCHYVPNERWYAAQEINAKLDSLDDVLLNLNWQDAFVSDPGTITSHATYVESLYSDKFVPESSYVEIGVFEHEHDGTDYLMLVNRRCLSTETQAVTVVMNLDSVYMAQDMYNRDVYGFNNGRIAGITLAPGEGRLFKLFNTQLHTSITWADTINVQSSVAIPQGVQLTIEPGAVLKFSENSGLKINGVLDAKATIQGPWIYFTAIDTSESWWGVRFEDSSVDSLCIMKSCFIEYANAGISFSGASPDTIDNILIRNSNLGIYCENNSSPRISFLSVWDGTSAPIGIYCSNSAPTIESAYLYGNGSLYSKGIQILSGDPVIRGPYSHIDNFERGIDICGGDPVIYDVELRDNTECGIACNWSEDPVSGFCPSSSPTIDSNTVVGYSDCGIYAGPNAIPYIAHSRIFSNKIGIKSVDSSPTVFRTKILQNDSIGVYCSGSTTPNLGEVGVANSGNNEICNDNWNVYSECPDTVKAEKNWWCRVPPDTNKFYGLIDYTPYLSWSPDSIASERITDLTATLVDSCIALQWSAITIDTTGKSDPVNYYVVYRDTMPEFLPTSSESVAAVGTPGYLDCDDGIVGDTLINYFYVVKAVDYGYNMSSASNMVGEFDKSLPSDSQNDTSWPLIVAETHPQAVFADSMGQGCQLTGAKRLNQSDYVTHFDGSGWVTCWYQSTAIPPVWQFEGAYEMGIEPDKMYRIVIRNNHPAVILTMTGAVSDTHRIIPIAPGSSDNWVGYCFAVPCSISGPSGDDADLVASGFTGAKRMTNSDNLDYFDGSGFFTAWYKSTASPPTWMFEGDLSKSSVLVPGRGYTLMVKEGHAFNNDQWVYGPPPDYSKGIKAVFSSKTRMVPAKKVVSKVSNRVRCKGRASTNKRLALEKEVEGRRTR